MQRDRLLRREALREIVALQQAGNRISAGELYDAGRASCSLQVELNMISVFSGCSTLKTCALYVSAFSAICSGVRERARDVAAAGIADHPCEIADQEHHVVPQVLKLPHLVQDHRVAQVQVGGRWVEARLHAKRLAARELALEVPLEDQLVRPPVYEL